MHGDLLCGPIRQRLLLHLLNTHMCALSLSAKEVVTQRGLLVISCQWANSDLILAHHKA